MPNINNAAIVPSSAQPIADKGGFVTTPWQRYFNALGSAPAPIMPVTVGASPFSYSAGQAGTLSITGGTVSSVTLTRNSTTIPLPTSGAFLMANGDVIAITYSVLPTVNFTPA